MRIGAWVAVTCVVAAACSGGSDDTTTEPVDPDAPTTTSETRSVPTVPPSTIDGQSVDDSVDDGVVEVAPTLAPPPATTDPDADPNATVAPPSTDLVGDPQPSPDTTAAPPPTTAMPPPAACDRLADVGVPAEIEGFIQPIDTAENVLDGAGCRYTAGRFVTEVRFVPLSQVRDDWFQREGVQPVAEAGGDAVGFDGFIGADGSTGAGYTVVVAGGGEGAIVAIADFAGANLAAGFVAALAAQAA